MPAISQKRLAQWEAHDQLMLRLSEFEPGEIPCRGPRSGAWQSGNSTLQAYAARECWECPLVQQCRSYALEHEPDRSDVWGGMRPKQSQKQTALDLGNVA